MNSSVFFSESTSISDLQEKLGYFRRQVATLDAQYNAALEGYGAQIVNSVVDPIGERILNLMRYVGMIEDRIAMLTDLYAQQDKAYAQGAADCENGAGYQPIRAGDFWKAYSAGFEAAQDYASEASLRYAESGAAYEAYLDAKSLDGWALRDEEYQSWLDFHNAEFAHEPDPEREYISDPFIARVLANGEQAERDANAARLAAAGLPYSLDNLPF